MQATLAIIKPDATRRNIVGQIIRRAEDQDLAVAGIQLLRLTKRQAEGFYHVHRSKPFFDDLTSFMSEGPIVVIVLRGQNAIQRWRNIMGATDPAEAEEGTIRALFGENIERNSTHGSDSPESARFEIGYFFSGLDLVK
jgi:nucleoside-diphosphate kinase